MKTFRGVSNNNPGKIAVVVAQFNSYITDALLKGAKEALLGGGVKEEDIEVYFVPGAFEIPLACKRIFTAKEVGGIVALGAVIRGETPHFDFVAGECSKGLMNVSLEFAKPIANGVLTTDTVEQALNRAGIKYGNKGAEAAGSLLSLLALFSESGV